MDNENSVTGTKIWQQDSYSPIYTTANDESLHSMATPSNFFSFLNMVPFGNVTQQWSNSLSANTQNIASSSAGVNGGVSEAWYQAAGILMSLKHAPVNRPAHLTNGLTESPIWPDRNNDIFQRNPYSTFMFPSKGYAPSYMSQLPFEPGRDLIGSEVELGIKLGESSKNVRVSDADKSADAADFYKEKNRCQVCHKVYARPSTLKMHMRIHNGEKPYQCNICLKAFSQDANLTAHLRVHSGEKPFKCTVCDRRFAQSSSVTTHMRTHTGQRPHVCKHCSKGFADSSTLTKHIRTHTGEKPYQCRLCHMRFSQSGNLNRHMRMHNKKSH